MHETNAAKAEQKKAKQEQVLKKIRQLENRQKILLNRQSDMERRTRTRRRCKRCMFRDFCPECLQSRPFRRKNLKNTSRTADFRQNNRIQ